MKKAKKEEKKAKKEEVHRYEEDLYFFCNKRNENKKQYEKFMQYYNEFLELTKKSSTTGMYLHEEELLDFFSNYVKKEKINFFFESFIDAGYDSIYKEINEAFKDNLKEYKSSYTNYPGVKSVDEILTTTLSLNILASYNKNRDVLPLSLWLHTLIEKIKEFSKQLCDSTKYLNDAYPTFYKYYEHIVLKKQIPYELVMAVEKLIDNPHFFKDKNIDRKTAYLNYIQGFEQYTTEHNQRIATANVFRYIPKVEPEPTPSESDITSQTKPDVTSTVSNQEVTEEQSNDDILIQNYAESYLSVICEADANDIETALPSTSISGYDKIMLALLKKYEEYLEKLGREGKCTMADNHKYIMLDSIVSNIKS